MSRAYRNTLPTGTAYLFIHYCNAIFNVYRIKRALLDAGAKSKTAIDTGFGSPVGHIA